MKLGIWNRLAIVLIALTSLILPTWLIVSSNVKFAKAHEEGYQACVARAMEPNDGTLTIEACREIWPVGGRTSYGMAQWWEAVGATLIACILLYGLLWVAVSVAKWVWRGREV